MGKIIQSDVISTVEKALDLAPGVLSETTRAEEIEGWDSLGQLSILVALDTLFDGKIASIHGMAEADSMDKILGNLKRHSLL